LLEKATLPYSILLEVTIFFCGASTYSVSWPPITGLRDHTHTPHSVGLLWTSDQPDAETAP